MGSDGIEYSHSGISHCYLIFTMKASHHFFLVVSTTRLYCNGLRNLLVLGQTPIFFHFGECTFSKYFCSSLSSHSADSILALAILTLIFNIAGFLLGVTICRNGAYEDDYYGDDGIVIWAFVYVAWGVPTLCYLGVSTASASIMIKTLNVLKSRRIFNLFSVIILSLGCLPA